MFKGKLDDFTYSSARLMDDVLKNLYEKIQDKKIFSTPIDESILLYYF